MCGIYGSIRYENKAFDKQILKKIINDTESRGTDAYGVAYMDRDGKLHLQKEAGPFSNHWRNLKHIKRSELFIGHCRMSTHGEDVYRNIHPFPCLDGYLIHNGIAWNYNSIENEYSLNCEGECDSERIAKLINFFYDRKRDNIVEAFKNAVPEIHGDMALAWTNGRRLILVRRGNPICISEDKTGFYFSSLGNHLPNAGNVFRMEDEYMVLLAKVNNEWKLVEDSKVDPDNYGYGSARFRGFQGGSRASAGNVESVSVIDEDDDYYNHKTRYLPRPSEPKSEPFASPYDWGNQSDESFVPDDYLEAYETYADDDEREEELSEYERQLLEASQASMS